MRAKLIKIGNSRGVRLPKPLLEATGFVDEVEIEVEKGRIILMPAKKRLREGWAEAAERLVESGEADRDEDWTAWMNMRNEFDETEWTWPEDAVWPVDMPASTSTSSRSTPSEARNSRKQGRVRSSRRKK